MSEKSVQARAVVFDSLIPCNILYGPVALGLYGIVYL